MFSLISLFLRFPSYLYMAYLFKLPSRLIVERHLPTIAGADPGGGGGAPRNHVFSHEIPQHFSRLLPFGAIFLSAPPLT